MYPEDGDVRMEGNQGMVSESLSSETEDDEEVCKRKACGDGGAYGVSLLEGRGMGMDRESEGEYRDCSQKLDAPRSSPSRQLKLWRAPRTGNLRVRFSVGRGHGRLIKSSASTGERKDVLESDKGSKSVAHGAKHQKAGGMRKKAAGAEQNNGQSSSTDTDDDGELIQRAMKAKEEMLQRQRGSKAITPKKKQPKAGGVRPGSVNLKLLIDEGILFPGEGVLSLEYRGIRETADLHRDGRIHWKDNTFDSPSAFSIFIKRLVNPTRKADDGWKTVKFAGNYLDHYKLILAKRRSDNNPPACINSSPVDGVSSGKDPHKRQRIDPMKSASETFNDHSMPLASPDDGHSKSIGTEAVNYPSVGHVNCNSSGVEMLDEDQALGSDGAISRRDLGLHSKLLRGPLG